MIELAHPLALLLAPLPLLALRLLPPAPVESGALLTPERIGAAATARARPARATAARLAAPWLAWLALVAALAGPQTLTQTRALPASGRDVVLAIDLSGSMEREDFTLDDAPAARIDVVRRMAAAFARGRGGDRLGLVVFGDQAYVAAPLSFDVEAVAQAVEGMTIGLAGRSTAISDGLGLALKRLAASDARSRVAILLSDGTNTAGSVAPADAAALAAAMGVRVHTIAMGPLALSEGSTDRNAVDDVTLAAIAQASGGTAFRVRSQADFAAVNAALDALEASPTEQGVALARRALWVWPAALALLAALVALASPRFAA